MGETGLFVALFSGTWCLVGAIFLAVGLSMRRSWRSREERLRARTEGVVLEVLRHESRSSDSTSVSWNPLVEFEYEGRRISLECPESVSRKKYYEGQRVNVLYDPDDPAAFRIDGEESGRTLYRILTAVGAGCVAIGLVSALIIAGWAHSQGDPVSSVANAPGQVSFQWIDMR